MSGLPVPCSWSLGPVKLLPREPFPEPVHVREEDSPAAVVGVFKGIPEFVFQRRGVTIAQKERLTGRPTPRSVRSNFSSLSSRGMSPIGFSTTTGALGLFGTALPRKKPSCAEAHAQASTP